MIRLTKHLSLFCGLLVLYTVGFLYILELSIERHQVNFIWISAVSYGVAIFLTALILGKMDAWSGSGFAYHLATYLTCNVISMVWSVIVDGWYQMSILVPIFWGFGLFCHFLGEYFMQRNMIKGIPKEEIFD